MSLTSFTHEDAECNQVACYFGKRLFGFRNDLIIAGYFMQYQRCSIDHMRGWGDPHNSRERGEEKEQEEEE